MDLTSVQRRTLDELMRKDPLPVFETGLADDLRADLERRLASLAQRVPDGEQLWVTKSRLTKLHAQCEGLFMADHLGEGVFEYSHRLAVGSVVHKAVEIGVFARDLPHDQLVARSIEKLQEGDDRFADYAATLDEADRALLVAAAVEQVILFQATFPPLERAWTPAVEPKLQVSLLGGRVVLSARPDLMLGGVDGEEPMRARRIVLELKTGQDRPEHDEDLRFYALAATLRLGVPPYRVATVLLEDATWRAQDVTPDVLESAVRRVGDGYTRAGELIGGAEPRLSPGPWCSWCPRAQTCPEAVARKLSSSEV